MEYNKTIRLRDGRPCVLRSGTERDAEAALQILYLTHEQTDWLAGYPEEYHRSAEAEAAFLKGKAEDPRELELLAELDGAIVGSAGIWCVRDREKTRHRAEFGISVDRAYWGLGLGRAMTEACIACAMAAGYAQLELEAVAENRRAIALYEHLGFLEYGRNPRAFRSRRSGWQELVLMRLELDG